MEEFDKFRELSDKNLEKLQAMATENPNLQKHLQMYNQISGRSLSESARKAQEENDKRWDQLEADLGSKTQTMGAFSDSILQYGFKLPNPIPDEELNKEGDFAEFMNTYGSQGLDIAEKQVEEVKKEVKEVRNKSKEGSSEEEAQKKHKCDECRGDAGMKCTQCGVHYCSKECQKKAWPSHKKVCKKLFAARGF